MSFDLTKCSCHTSNLLKQGCIIPWAVSRAHNLCPACGFLLLGIIFTAIFFTCTVCLCPQQMVKKIENVNIGDDVHSGVYCDKCDTNPIKGV